MATWDFTTPFDAPADLPDEWVWERLRRRRNHLLAESDWTQTSDAPGDRDKWRTYRQALRDLPDVTEDPRKAAWPTPPVVGHNPLMEITDAHYSHR